MSSRRRRHDNDATHQADDRERRAKALEFVIPGRAQREPGIPKFGARAAVAEHVWIPGSLAARAPRNDDLRDFVERVSIWRINQTNTDQH
ncbi:hypothetical protein RPB_0905 [Rhodopseudomonas palustris HaA2]|uniref:Uncharacterized protein n=1 Tax=Rhodopseudomonas palustris (strain HaA2) TaxID=316058 RepID=Q2J1P4_RHOP2|nr:hypothetical protein RPB_0905 [Rhodopseudomonas palustris HaA2]